MKKFIFIVSFFFFLVNSQAQAPSSNREDNKKEYTNGFGIALGSSTGWGLSYRALGDKYGVQLTGAPVISSDFSLISFGATLLYKISNSENTSFYLYQGNNFIYSDGFINSGSSVNLVNGIGIGFELMVSKNISINALTGYGLYTATNVSTSLYPSAEFAIYYIF